MTLPWHHMLVKQLKQFVSRCKDGADSTAMSNGCYRQKAVASTFSSRPVPSGESQAMGLSFGMLGCSVVLGRGRLLDLLDSGTEIL